MDRNLVSAMLRQDHGVDDVNQAVGGLDVAGDDIGAIDAEAGFGR